MDDFTSNSYTTQSVGVNDLSIMASGPSDVTTHQDPADATEECTGKKKSRFQTFKNFFAKKKRKESASPAGDSGLKSSQSSDNVNVSEPGVFIRTENDKGSGSKINLGNKALSHESVFVSDSPVSEVLGASQNNVHGKVKSLQFQLKQSIGLGSPALHVKKGDDTGTLSEDDGLPCSPPEYSTLHTVLGGVSHRSSSLMQRNSSLSLEGTDSDEDQISYEAGSRSISPLVSLPVDFSQPASPIGCLDNCAARHRLAVRQNAYIKTRKPTARVDGRLEGESAREEGLGVLITESVEEDEEDVECMQASAHGEEEEEEEEKEEEEQNDVLSNPEEEDEHDDQQDVSQSQDASSHSLQNDSGSEKCLQGHAEAPALKPRLWTQTASFTGSLDSLETPTGDDDELLLAPSGCEGAEGSSLLQEVLNSLKGPLTSGLVLETEKVMLEVKVDSSDAESFLNKQADHPEAPSLPSDPVPEQEIGLPSGEPDYKAEEWEGQSKEEGEEVAVETHPVYLTEGDQDMPLVDMEKEKDVSKEYKAVELEDNINETHPEEEDKGEEVDEDEEHERIVLELDQVDEDEEHERVVLELDQVDEDEEHERVVLELEEVDEDEEHERVGLEVEEVDEDKEHERVVLEVEEVDEDKEHERVGLEEIDEDEEHKRVGLEDVDEDDEQERVGLVEVDEDEELEMRESEKENLVDEEMAAGGKVEKEDKIKTVSEVPVQIAILEPEEKDDVLSPVGDDDDAQQDPDLERACESTKDYAELPDQTATEQTCASPLVISRASTTETYNHPEASPSVSTKLPNTSSPGAAAGSEPNPCEPSGEQTPPEDHGKTCSGSEQSRPRFTIAPAWQRVSIQDPPSPTPSPAPTPCGPGPVDTGVTSNRDPPSGEEPLSSVVVRIPASPSQIQCHTAPVTLPTDTPPATPAAPGEETPENLFGVRLRKTSLGILRLGSESDTPPASPAHSVSIEPQRVLFVDSPPNRRPALPRKPAELGSVVKPKRKPDLSVGQVPGGGSDSPSWISVARQKQRIFKENSLEETTEKDEQKSKTVVPALKSPVNKDPAKLPGSSGKDIVVCSLESSKPTMVNNEGKRAGAHPAPTSLAQDEPPWMALAKKKSKAWSEMPQIVQ
ncbi:hypothetical protein DPEC_G00023780 [Dallia pectoralis]|uniref:Uncharacterized protein n=1 Tax=Dallia pectoralis TaxID=75939 RepID=A0ACC2HH18_DALPE|nr:hypothetical protein DPEC_G00023780 [Dallia pectoralis]